MDNSLINRQDAIDAICTWDKFGVDERGRMVRWYEGLEPYVHLRDVVSAIEKIPSAGADMSSFCDRLWKKAYDRGFEDGRKSEWTAVAKMEDE